MGLPLGLAAVARVGEHFLLLSVLLVVLFAAAAALMWLYFRNTRIDFGDGFLSSTKLFGTTQRWSIDQIGQVIVVEKLMAFMQPDTHNTFILDGGGRCILRPTNQRWTRTDVLKLVEWTGHTPKTIKKPIMATVVRQRYPGAVPWWEAHTFSTALIAVGSFAVVFFTVYWLVDPH